MTKTILVTGASVAGCTAAWWLGRYGFDVTVVETAPEFRDGGQNVDVRGVGREVLRRMGLEEAALAHNTGERGTAWVEADGSTAAEFITQDIGGDGPTAEMEILRGDLARLIYEPAREHATFRFGDRIASIEEMGEGAQVTFESGTRETFDAVIVAEGVGSTTRELVVPGENDPKHLDMTIAYFTIPRTQDDDDRWRWYHAPGGRSISLRPDDKGTTRAMLSLVKPPEGEERWDRGRQKAFLRETFADAGWEAERVLAGMDETQDFYLDVLRQVRLLRWSRGPVALVGDAAWCVTPLGGIGTTLAVTGAYVLASEIGRASTMREAFLAYEQALRPMLEKRGNVPRIGPKLANPQSRLGISVLHRVLKVASSPVVTRTAGIFGSGAPDETDPNLSRYDGLLARSGLAGAPGGDPQ